MNTTPFWKKINQTVSGYSQNVTQDIVSEILKLSKKELVEGFLNYKPYSKKGYDEWIAVANVSNFMKEFVHELSQDINLDTSTAYPVMCNYLMFEYYGKIKEFWQITRIGTTINLKESIWNFYTAERMFHLKTLRHIFEFVNKNYEFAQQYEEFLASINIEELQNNLIKQFECLINEITPKNSDEKNKHFENWLCRNCREQTEIAMILILTVRYHSFNITQLTQICKLFVQNNFGTQAPYFEITQFLNKRDLQELMDKDLTEFWKKPATLELDKSLLNLHLNRGHTIIMFGWLILKYKSVRLEYDGERILELLKKRPFTLLHSIVSNDIFKNCTVGEVVLKAAHRMLDELCLMYNDRKMLYEEEGLVSVASEFLKQPDLAEICLKTRNGLDSVLEIAIESFPYDFFSFTAISQTLLGQKFQYKNTIHLLNNIPSFLSDMTWTIPKEEISVLRKSQRAFPNSDLIVFPPNTTVSGLTQRIFDEELVKKVIAGYNVVIQGIKHCVDMDLEVIGLQRCIEKLNKILIHLDGPLLHFELVKLYFDLHNAMVICRQNSFFDFCPEIVWKIFFPKLKPEYVSADVTKLLFNQYIFEDTIFMKLFQQEESKEDHTLMLTYIEILHNIMRYGPTKMKIKSLESLYSV
ncbi:hypothetical protein BDFB_000244 [Asbolus verrucosus]|uniref:Uncharacterized protein n=1 Tax=Asbolus verrucosus TaxID=1661398 RepID=A0A482VUK4_ASBVE|nr:hypothetical protein BDFB_000244 [Asbolus verrucosus]